MASFRVAVSQRIDHVQGINEIRDSLDSQLIKWISNWGGMAFPVSNHLGVGASSEAIERWLDCLVPQAIILSGGNNLKEFPQRDSTESMLLDWAEKHLVPVLAICRGVQFMAVRAGAELKPVENHVRSKHRIVSLEGECFPEEVNSYHHFSLKNCPKEYEVIAISVDDQIEAIRHRHLKWEGWMWHPEREKKFCDIEVHRVKQLFGIT